MQPELLSLLQSPTTGEPLRYEDNGQCPSLVGTVTGERFAVREGIPVFVENSQVTGLNRRYQRFYDWAAPYYDWGIRVAARLSHHVEAETRQSYLAALALRPGDRFLEVAVGTGANLRYLPADIELHGLDLSWSMLQQCQRSLEKLGRRASLVLATAERLPYRDSSFDAVLHVGGINAFNDRAAALAEMVRVARPDARLVVVDETAQPLRKLSWIPGIKRMLTEHADRFVAPRELLPGGLREIESRAIADGNLYCLTFRKSAHPGQQAAAT